MTHVCSAIWDVDEFKNDSLISTLRSPPSSPVVESSSNVPSVKLKQSTQGTPSSTTTVSNSTNTTGNQSGTTTVNSSKPPNGIQMQNASRNNPMKNISGSKVSPNENTVSTSLRNSRVSQPTASSKKELPQSSLIHPRLNNDRTPRIQRLINITQTKDAKNIKPDNQGIKPLINDLNIPRNKDLFDKQAVEDLADTISEAKSEPVRKVHNGHLAQDILRRDFKPLQGCLPSVQIVDITPRRKVALEAKTDDTESSNRVKTSKSKREKTPLPVKINSVKNKSSRDLLDSAMPEIMTLKLQCVSRATDHKTASSIRTDTPSAAAVEGSAHSSRTSCSSPRSVGTLGEDLAYESDEISSCDSFTTAVKRYDDMPKEETEVEEQTIKPIRGKMKSMQKQVYQTVPSSFNIKKVSSEDLSTAELISTSGSLPNDVITGKSTCYSMPDIIQEETEDIATKLFRSNGVDLKSYITKQKSTVPIGDLLPAVDRVR